MIENSNINTGYLLIAHGALAQEMLNTLEFIAGKQTRFKAVALDHGLDVDRAREVVKESIGELMSDSGVLVFTDLFGGSPSNIALSMLDEINIEIVAGVNLPMLIHAVNIDDNMPLREKAEKLREYGMSNIFVASEVLAGKRNS
ncbi:PTS system, mannose-specific IIA component [hydrothermal vent metagenome]|uniref:PTS system, mannose-specific IIA component n=1 Tax=hydrothermal vent metagenome TaxID=652676 RepID=A0A3B1C8J9_9ZZZZ